MEKLLQPLRLGALLLPNRILMAPLTRCRATVDHLSTPLMAQYYGQRSTAGLIIAEATMVMDKTSAFQTEPGLYNKAQVEAWRKVTEHVHARDGRIFVQLWHGGRACHPRINGGQQPVSACAVAITNDMAHIPEGKVPYTVPRPLGDEELEGIVDGFKMASVHALEAGFDGVEIHGANGYLLDQFLRDGCNRRTGIYGGPIENRARLLISVLEAVCALWGPGRVGVRLSPLSSFNSMGESDPVALTSWLARRLNSLPLAYVHLVRGDVMGILTGDILTPMRKGYAGTLVANLGYSPLEANAAIGDDLCDAVAFGTSYIANPDLVERIRLGAPLNQPNPHTFYKPGPVGYIDYPFLT